MPSANFSTMNGSVQLSTGGSGGGERCAPSNPNTSVPRRRGSGSSLPVVIELKLCETLNWRTGLSGNSLVRTSTDPPEKSPGLSGVALLLTTIDSSSDDGKMSRGTIFVVGSGLASSTPLSSVLL